jgi:hypothetical protein
MLHALAAAHKSVKKDVVICWETAGTSISKLTTRLGTLHSDIFVLTTHRRFPTMLVTAANY